MIQKLVRRAAPLVAVTFAVAVQAATANAETKVGSSIESRVTVAFQVEGDSLQGWLPDAWAPIPFPSGPLAGANLLMVLADQQLQLDPEGKTKQPPGKLFVVFAGLGKSAETDAVRFFAYRAYSSDMTEDPYQNTLPASVERITSMSGTQTPGRNRSESWNIAAEGGGELTIDLNFTSGPLRWAPGEANPYSNTNPDFNRIYRYEQLLDLAMSNAIGKPLAGELTYSASVPELAAIFDGSESLVAILDIPVYVRDIFLP